MAGPGSSSGGGGKYLSIFAGGFVQKCKPDADGAVMRLNKNGVEVWEKHHEYIDGIIKEIKTSDYEYKPGKFQKNIEIIFDCDGEKWTIQTPYNGNFCVSFLQRFVNVGLNKLIRLKPYSFDDKESGKKRSGFVLYANAEETPENKIDSFWGGPDSGKPTLPKWVDTGHVDGQGNTVWDRKAFMGTINAKVGEVIKATQGTTPQPTAKPSNQVEAAQQFAAQAAAKKGEKTEANIPHVPFDEDGDSNESASWSSGDDDDGSDLPF